MELILTTGFLTILHQWMQTTLGLSPYGGIGLCGEIPAEPHFIPFPHTDSIVSPTNVELRIDLDAAVYLVV